MTGTAVAEVKAIVLAGAGELLGSDSPYERGRLALRNEYGPILVASAELKAIASQEDAEEATKFGRLLQVGKTETEKYFKDIKLQIDAIKKPVLDAEKIDVGALENEKRRLGAMQTVWDQECRRKQEEADRIAREEAARVAREEQLARAIAMEAEGEMEQAEAVLEEPMQMIMTTTQRQTAKPRGAVTTTTYGAKVTGWDADTKKKPLTDTGWKNFRLLVAAVAKGEAPIQALLPNESFINGQGDSYKEGFSMPGCEMTRKVNTSYRG